MIDKSFMMLNDGLNRHKYQLCKREYPEREM